MPSESTAQLYDRLHNEGRTEAFHAYVKALKEQGIAGSDAWKQAKEMFETPLPKWTYRKVALWVIAKLSGRINPSFASFTCAATDTLLNWVNATPDNRKSFDAMHAWGFVWELDDLIEIQGDEADGEELMKRLGIGVQLRGANA